MTCLQHTIELHNKYLDFQCKHAMQHHIYFINKNVDVTIAKLNDINKKLKAVVA